MKKKINYLLSNLKSNKIYNNQQINEISFLTFENIMIEPLFNDKKLINSIKNIDIIQQMTHIIKNTNKNNTLLSLSVCFFFLRICGINTTKLRNCEIAMHVRQYI